MGKVINRARLSLNVILAKHVSMASQSILSFVAIALFVIGIAGNGFEMRKIRMSTKDGEIVSKNTFFDRRTFKWYVLIGIALALLAVSDLY